MPKGKRYSPELQAQIYGLLSQNYSSAEVTRQLGLPPSTVSSYHRKWRGTTEFENHRQEDFQNRISMCTRMVSVIEVLTLEAMQQRKLAVEKLPSAYAIFVDKLVLLNRYNLDGQPEFSRGDARKDRELTKRLERFMGNAAG